MKRVMLIGFDPATVDYSDPALPPGMNAEKIQAGVKLALADRGGRLWQPWSAGAEPFTSRLCGGCRSNQCQAPCTASHDSGGTGDERRGALRSAHSQRRL